MPPGSVRWAEPENLHLTLRFLGPVRAETVEKVESDLREAVRGERVFELCAGRLGCFPHPESPRVLWIGVEGALETLHDLQDRVEQATRLWGKVEVRTFHPHLTLGRVNTNRRIELRAMGEALEQCPGRDFPAWRVDAVHLMRSVLAPGGSQYTMLALVPLSA